MTDPETDSGQAQVWRITIPVIASASEVEELTDRLVNTLCPDADHEGPCPIPWALHVTDGRSLPNTEQRRLRAEIADTKRVIRLWTRLRLVLITGHRAGETPGLDAGKLTSGGQLQRDAGQASAAGICVLRLGWN